MQELQSMSFASSGCVHPTDSLGYRTRVERPWWIQPSQVLSKIKFIECVSKASHDSRPLARKRSERFLYGMTSRARIAGSCNEGQTLTILENSKCFCFTWARHCTSPKAIYKQTDLPNTCYRQVQIHGYLLELSIRYRSCVIAFFRTERDFGSDRFHRQEDSSRTTMLESSFIAPQLSDVIFST